ncbi:hypothetical protein K2Y00_01355 [Patescibacteria group bacterium]|nr:hypothetical protein [Patescibacteria group bacterium]
MIRLTDPRGGAAIAVAVTLFCSFPISVEAEVLEKSPGVQFAAAAHESLSAAAALTGNLFVDVWCGVTSWLSLDLCKEAEPIAPRTPSSSPAPATPTVPSTVVTTTIPPPAEVLPSYTVSTSPSGTPTYTTVVENTYVTNNPTTIIRESASGGGGSSSGVSQENFSNQVDRFMTP